MNSYMPQDVFNVCAVTAALHESVSIEDFAKQISDVYRQRYIDDGFNEDIITAAYNVVELMKTAFPGKKVTPAILQIQYCIDNYHPNGKKKSFLRGQLFNKQMTPLPNRVTQCRTDVMTFHFGTLAGTFPIVPKGWSL